MSDTNKYRRNKWEYQVIKQIYSAIGGVQNLLNTLGAQGWELVNVQNDIAFLKRKIK